MTVETAIYDSKVSYNSSRRPMVVASSGGGGHIAAAQGLIQNLPLFAKNIIFAQYDPLLSTESSPSPTQATIETAIDFMHTRYVGPLVKNIIKYTPYPWLPNKESLIKEIESLNQKEKRQGKRYYKDMLLDVYPAGYPSVALWNLLQRDDQADDLNKLVALQPRSDNENYKAVYEHFLAQLKAAANEGIPFTELISTQAMALPALCDAIIAYNQWLKENEHPFPEVIIHQYMTDLPTKGAIHFLTPLAHLSIEQQQQIKLYAVELNDDVLKHFFPNGNHFAGTYNIPAKENPMVRAGFKDSHFDNSNKFHLDTEITLKWYGEGITEKKFSIKAHETIASIMLGSQAGKDTVEYIENLLESGFDKVFVFGNNETITQKIAQIKKKMEYADKEIISLGNQGDKEIASLMTRSNLLIIRGGGLSVMEQLAMNHHSSQIVLTHNPNGDPNKEPTSGIPWEDENAEKLKRVLDKKIYVQKTTPKRAKRQIPEARLRAVLNTLDITAEKRVELEALISKMPKKVLKLFANLVNSTYLKENSHELLRFLSIYSQECSNGNQINRFGGKWLTVLNIVLRENTLGQKVEYFFNPSNNETFFNAEYLRSILITIAYQLEALQGTKNYELIKATILPIFSYIASNDRKANILKGLITNVTNACKSVRDRKVFKLLNELASQIYFDMDMDQIVLQLAQLSSTQQNWFFSLLKPEEKNQMTLPLNKLACLKPNPIASLRLEIRKNIEDYIYTRKNNQNVLYQKIIQKKIDIAEKLLSKINKLKAPKDQEEEKRVAQKLTKLLLITQTKNEEIIRDRIASKGYLGNILENGLCFLNEKYLSAFQKGREDFLKMAEKHEKFSLRQQLKRLINLFIKKIIGKKIEVIPITVNQEREPDADSTISTNPAINVTDTNHRISSESQAPINPENQRVNRVSKTQVNSRYSFHQVPSNNTSNNETDPTPKPWQSYCSRR